MKPFGVEPNEPSQIYWLQSATVDLWTSNSNASSVAKLQSHRSMTMRYRTTIARWRRYMTVRTVGSRRFGRVA